MWETSVDLYQYIQEQVQDVYEYVFSILGVEDPDEEFNAGTYVQGTAVAGYYVENGSSYVDTSFSYVMGTNMPVGSTIYTAPWGSCVTTAVPSGTALVITPSTGAVTMNVPVTRTNFDQRVSLTAVQIGWNNNQKPLYNAQSRTTPYQGTGSWIGIQKQIDSTNLSGASGQPYYNPLPTGTTTFNDYRQAVVIYVNNNNGSLDDITVDDIPTWQELTGEESTEPTEPTESGNGDIIINNYDTLNIDNDISGNADIDFNGTVDIDVSAGAGAFGAGAVVVSGKVDASLTNDGDFVLNADGMLDIAEISLNGDTVTYNQNYTVDSGGTVTNSNITNNYYTIESGVTVELPSYPAIDYTIDYDEILSEQELYDILSTETYEIASFETDLYSLELQTVPPIEQLSKQLTLTSGAVVSEGADVINDLGLTPLYSSLAVFTIICFILRGGR